MSHQKSKQSKKRAPPKQETGRRTSRTPGVDVGEVVNTSEGKKRKVCFNIGGKWYFRMVDPGWRAPARPSKARSRKSAGKQARGEGI